MISAGRSTSQTLDRDDSRDERDSRAAAQEQSAPATLVAYILVLPKDSEPLIATLQKLTAHTVPSPGTATIAQKMTTSSESEDLWLGHKEAAEYLGIAESTLYRYSEQERMESRKLGGRLEYRRSALDKFRDQHVRPARRWLGGRGIMATALGSGK